MRCTQDMGGKEEGPADGDARNDSCSAGKSQPTCIQPQRSRMRSARVGQTRSWTGSSRPGPGRQGRAGGRRLFCDGDQCDLTTVIICDLTTAIVCDDVVALSAGSGRQGDEDDCDKKGGLGSSRIVVVVVVVVVLEAADNCTRRRLL